MLLGIMPAGIGRGGRYSAPEEGRSLFGKTTYEQLRVVGSKGGRASALARQMRAAELAEENAFSDAMYRGPEPGPIETTHAASLKIDAAFPHLQDAFKKTEAQVALQATGRAGGTVRDVRVLVGGQLRSVSDAAKDVGKTTTALRAWMKNNIPREQWETTGSDDHPAGPARGARANGAPLL